jgi:hypothetical protein
VACWASCPSSYSHRHTGLVGIVSVARRFNSTLGFIPIYGADVALHALTVLPVGYFAWFAADTRLTRAHPAVART